MGLIRPPARLRRPRLLLQIFVLFKSEKSGNLYKSDYIRVVKAIITSKCYRFRRVVLQRIANDGRVGMGPSWFESMKQ